MPRLTHAEVNAEIELNRFEDDGNPNHAPAISLNSLERFFLTAWENPQVAQPNGERIEHITLAPYRPEDYEPAPDPESGYYTGQRKGSAYNPKADWDLVGKDGGR